MDLSRASLLVSFWLVASPFGAPKARADDAFNPSSFIQSKEAEKAQAEVTFGEVFIKGVRYKVFRTAVGTLYVPKVTGLSKDDIDRGLCANEIPVILEKCLPSDEGCSQRNREHMTQDVTVARVDTPMGADMKAYAEWVTLTVRKRCGDVNTTYFTPIPKTPEIGVEVKGGTERDPRTYKVYNQGLKPQVGFKTEW